MERWRRWGLSFDEWEECQRAAQELADLSAGDRTPSAEEIAAQLAVAKAAEEELPPTDEPVTSVRVERR